MRTHFFYVTLRLVEGGQRRDFTTLKGVRAGSEFEARRAVLLQYIDLGCQVVKLSPTELPEPPITALDSGDA